MWATVCALNKSNMLLCLSPAQDETNLIRIIFKESVFTWSNTCQRSNLLNSPLSAVVFSLSSWPATWAMAIHNMYRARVTAQRWESMSPLLSRRSLRCILCGELKQRKLRACWNTCTTITLFLKPQTQLLLSSLHLLNSSKPNVTT